MTFADHRVGDGGSADWLAVGQASWPGRRVAIGLPQFLSPSQQRAISGRSFVGSQGMGVYDVAWGTDTIRVLVLSEVPAADRNTILNLFSSEPSRIAAGVNQFRREPHELSSVIEELLKKYLGEPDMPQTLAEMIRDSQARVIADIPDSGIVENLPFERLKDVKALIERRLAESEKKKPASPRATRGRRNSGTASR